MKPQPEQGLLFETQPEPEPPGELTRVPEPVEVRPVVVRCGSCGNPLEIPLMTAQVIGRAGGQIIVGRGDYRKPDVCLQMKKTKRHRCSLPTIALINLRKKPARVVEKKPVRAVEVEEGQRTILPLQRGSATPVRRDWRS